MLREPVHATRTGRSRRTSGTSATSTRRCTPGRRCSCYKMEQDARPGGPRLPGAVVPGADAELQLVGEPQGPGRAATSSPAASSGSTTSASSIAARRCRPAARSSRPTAPRGWRSTARTCSRSRSILAEHDPHVRGGRVQVRRALHLDRLRDGPHRRATTTRCGTRRTASSTTCCGCPTASATRLKVRSMVGPAAALRVDGVRAGRRRRSIRRLLELIALFRKRHPELVAHVAPTDAGLHRLRAAAACCRSLQQDEAASACSATCSTRTSSSARTASARSRGTTCDHPFVFQVGGQEYQRAATCPAESNTGMFGGNSNWRGPVWMPVNALIVRGAAQPLRVLRRRLHGRVPDRLRAAA